MDKILEVNNLNYSFGDNIVFDDLQFSIKKSTTNLILGPNSCGKTTLIRCLCGIFPNKDNISVDNINLNKQNLKNYLLSIGVVFFDDPNKFLFNTVLEELSFPLENLNYNRKDISYRIDEVKKILKLNNCINKDIEQLTYFEQAKVLIGVAIMHNPKIIFLDNALNKLNREEIEELFTIFNKLKEEITICITSSNLEAILSFDNVIVLGNCKTLITGTPKEVLVCDNELSKLGLLIPPMIDLSLKLGFYELLDDIITDVNGMVDKLWK